MIIPFVTPSATKDATCPDSEENTPELQQLVGNLAQYTMVQCHLHIWNHKQSRMVVPSSTNVDNCKDLSVLTNI